MSIDFNMVARTTSRSGSPMARVSRRIAASISAASRSVT